MEPFVISQIDVCMKNKETISEACDKVINIISKITTNNVIFCDNYPYDISNNNIIIIFDYCYENEGMMFYNFDIFET